MGRARSIARPLKASKNSSGLKLEIKKSYEFHQEGVPLLISAALLRARGLGQLDLCRMKKKESWMIEVAEVKSSHVGEEAILQGQRKRIFESQRFLSSIFGAPSKLIRLIG